MSKKSRKDLDYFLSNCFIGIIDDWSERSVYDIPHFIITNDKGADFEGGFDSFCGLKKKEEFYHLAGECLDIIYKFADTVGETVCCAGPFLSTENYEHWSNLKEFDAFNTLTEHIKNEQYKVIDLPESQNLVGLIIENNFRYLSQIALLFADTDIIIQPTHNAEILVFAKDCEKAKNLFAEILVNGWFICE